MAESLEVVSELMAHLGTEELFDGKGLWDTMGGDVWRAAKNARETRFRWTTDQLKRHAIGQELFNDGQQEGQGIELGELKVPIRPSNLM